MEFIGIVISYNSTRFSLPFTHSQVTSPNFCRIIFPSLSFRWFGLSRRQIRCSKLLTSGLLFASQKSLTKKFWYFMCNEHIRNFFSTNFLGGCGQHIHDSIFPGKYLLQKFSYAYNFPRQLCRLEPDFSFF